MKLPVKKSDGAIDLIEVPSIYYLEAAEGDTRIRTARKKPYRSIQELAQLERRLPSPPFVRCHRSFVVNLDRVRSIVARGYNDHDFRMDPPVNRRIPISRKRFKKVLAVLGL